MSMYNDNVWRGKKKRILMYGEIRNRSRICEKICAWSLIISWAWIGNEMVRELTRARKWDRVAENTMLNISESGHPEFRWPNVLERRDLKSKKKRKIVFAFLWSRRHSRIDSSHNHFRQSAVADVCDELVCRISGCSESTRKPVSRLGPRQSARKLAARLRTKIRKSSRSSIDQTVLKCRNHEDRDDGTEFHDPRRCGTGQIGRLMSRVCFYIETAQHPM